MKKDKLASIIALLMMLSMVFSLVNLQTVNAQTNTMTAYAFVGARPNPVGVGQDVLVHFGITAPTQNATESYKGITVTVERPDGHTDTLGPFSTDSTGGSGTIYTPDIAGEYILQTHFPAQWYNFTGVGVMGPVYSFTYYNAADSEELKLVVQNDPVPYYPGVPLPSEYWTRPIDAQARSWYNISGSWLYTPDNRFILNNAGPETAHILWTRPLTIGGLAGGDVGLAESVNQGAVGFGTGDAYEGIWSSRFILAGKLYYAVSAAGMLTSSGSPEPVEYHCVDLHTGEEQWVKTFMDNQTLSFAQLLYYQGFNYMGTFAYLWITTGGYNFFTGTYLPGNWYAFNAYTGNPAFTILNVPAGTTLRDSNGGLHVLVVDQTNGWMALWNMTQFVESSATGYYVGGGSWGNVVNGMTFDAGAATAAAKAAYSWNVTIPTGLPGSVGAAFFGDRVVGSNLAGGFGGGSVPSTFRTWGLSLEEGNEGTVLFNQAWASPSDWVTGNQSISWAAWSGESEVGVLWSKELRQHYGVSLETGRMIWGPTPSQYYLDIYEGTQLTSHLIAYDKLYACGVAGILYCYDVKTGDLLWNYTAKDPYTESMFSSNWWLGITFITDGKLYVGSGEHSANQPLPRGAPFLCLDAETGDLIWRANGLFRQTGWGGLAIIGDSIMATMDTFDQRVYAVGKGPSATTVSAPDVGVALGSTIMIKGTVTDVSPGTTSSEITLRFPNGVPAGSDESMSDWMLYVYKQFALPASATGVEVVLSVLDSNGNFYEIGRTNSSSDGYYSLAYTPTIPGKFQVFASFEGSNAYYGSHAETSFFVEPAPEETAPPTPSPAPMTDAYMIGLGAGALVAIVAIGLIIILMLRKR